MSAEQIKELLRPLFIDYDKEMAPASEGLIAEFCRQVQQRNIPEPAVEQLTGFYRVTNGVPCLNGFDFHRCDDDILYEWWDTDGHLWLGSFNDDVLRLADGKFCLGDAGNISYSDNDEFTTLRELIERVVGEM